MNRKKWNFRNNIISFIKEEGKHCTHNVLKVVFKIVNFVCLKGNMVRNQDSGRYLFNTENCGLHKLKYSYFFQRRAIIAKYMRLETEI